jgi:flavin reductase (NADH)/flavin reductase
MERALFKQGMRRVSGAVTIVTTRGVAGERRGVTATAVCSLSASPPAVIACINRDTWVGQLAPASGVFCVNVLSRAQRHVAETFAGRTGHVAEDRFLVGDWQALESGAPALREAIACFDCRLDRCVEFASHVLLVGEVGRTIVGPAAAEPLIYFDGAFTTSALPD